MTPNEAARQVCAACDEAQRKDPVLDALYARLKSAQEDQNRERRRKIKAELAGVRSEIFRLRASIRPKIKALNARILRLQIKYRTPAYPANIWTQIAARKLQLDKRAGEKLVRKRRNELIRNYKHCLHESQ